MRRNEVISHTNSRHKHYPPTKAPRSTASPLHNKAARAMYQNECHCFGLLIYIFSIHLLSDANGPTHDTYSPRTCELGDVVGRVACSYQRHSVRTLCLRPYKRVLCHVRVMQFYVAMIMMIDRHTTSSSCSSRNGGGSGNGPKSSEPM